VLIADWKKKKVLIADYGKVLIAGQESANYRLREVLMVD
jgi:hypothetical protein